MLDVKLRNSVGKKSDYRGCCDIFGRRDGFGSETWKKQEQTYEGAFFDDTFHGEGSYKWLARKEKTFEGYFYSGSKEGYGVLSFTDGSVFEGLFNKNQAFGPGIYTYTNGRQDVGFWSGNKIVRLCRPVDFIIPRLASTCIGKLKLLQFQTLTPFAEENADVGAALLFKHGVEFHKSCRLYSNFIHDPRSLFFNRIRFDKVYFVKIEGPEESTPVSAKQDVDELKESKDFSRIPRNICGYTEEVNIELDGFAEEADPSESIHVIAWNRSELCMEMLKQIFRFRSFEDNLSFKISDLMAGERMKFRKTGEMERVSVHFLKMCSIGPSYIVKEMLCTGNVSVELMDARGNNSVMFAAATDQHDIIDILLNHGADVNAFNDENLTPLNICLLRRICQTYTLGNWEVCFLPPIKPAFIVNEEKQCGIRKSVESMDRIFGDGMSILSEVAIEEREELDENDSIFCFEGEDSSQIATSDITLLHCNAAEEQGARSILGMARPKEDKHFQPSSYKRDEFLNAVADPTDRDTYFFDLSLENTWRRKSTSVASELETETECLAFFNEKIVNIDKTIELLLDRGADPNLADAPKPSIHLAVYCKEPKLVRLLLTYGASPDTQSLPQEGLLTPLHVVVLMKPSKEQVEICELLLNYGASPEEETLPSFNPNSREEFLDFLDPDHGRTPLQLLCTRQDAEYVDDKGFLRQVAYLLAKVSKKNKLFKGHSYLTLSMMCGNYGIMEAILKCKRLNPNEILGKDLGTSFHVLVSTDLQKRTSFENSIRMCELLLENGGNPNITFDSPRSLFGTCVDYGYREIEKEKQRRQSKSGEIKKKWERDHLEDHLKVVEYIAKKSKWESKNLDVNNGAGSRKKKNYKRSLENKTEDLKTIRNSSAAVEEITIPEKDNPNIRDMKKDKGISKEKGNSRLKEIKNNTTASVERSNSHMKGLKKNVTISKEKMDPEIIEIKKHVAEAKEKAVNVTKNRNQITDNVGKRKVIRKEFVRNGVNTNDSKEIRSRRIKRSDYSERLPERFRQSLLHVFGICGGFNINELLLPYVVMRNGDLYYRFKGHKLSRTEQYSLI